MNNLDIIKVSILLYFVPNINNKNDNKYIVTNIINALVSPILIRYIPIYIDNNIANTLVEATILLYSTIVKLIYYINGVYNDGNSSIIKPEKYTMDSNIKNTT